MHGRSEVRGAAACLAGIFLLLAAAPARAFTFFDGRLEVHGYVAGQIRTLAKNLSVDEQWDLAQWYNVVDVEVEAKPFPKGLGPIEILEFYARAEARYDCVWTRACGIFPSRRHLRRPCRAPPQSTHPGRRRRLHGHAAQRRLAAGVERGPQQLPARLPRRRPSVNCTSRCASTSCPAS